MDETSRQNDPSGFEPPYPDLAIPSQASNQLMGSNRMKNGRLSFYKSGRLLEAYIAHTGVTTPYTRHHYMVKPSYVPPCWHLRSRPPLLTTPAAAASH